MAIVIVTGCSSGFGEAIALGFARRGDNVVATMRKPGDASAALANEPRVEVAALDVTDAAGRQRVIDEVGARHGRIDVLVNNAGVFVSGAVEDVPEDVARRLFDTNYFGPVELMRLVLPVMRAQGGGRIVNVTALGAILASALMSTYTASKHALDAVSAALDIEGRVYGVRCPTVLPGQFKTSINDKAPAPILTDPYRPLAESLDASRRARAADVLTDLSSVVEAVIEAATSPDPRQRYVAGVGIADEVKGCVAELQRLQGWDAARAGVG